MGERWVALNPAHVPYWPQIRSKGFAKVGKVAGSGETMARSVARNEAFSDGTRPPTALVHCNNFFAEEPKTKSFASVAFGPKGRLEPIQTEDGTVPDPDGVDVAWFFSGYEIMA